MLGLSFLTEASQLQLTRSSHQVGYFDFEIEYRSKNYEGVLVSGQINIEDAKYYWQVRFY